MKKTLIAFAIAAALMAASPAAFAGVGEPSDSLLVPVVVVTGDLLIVRPVSVVYAAGAAVAWPFVAAFQWLQGRDIEPVTDALIYEPYWFIVERPLGEFYG